MADYKNTPRIELNPSSADRWTTCTASPQFIFDNWSKIPPQDTAWSKEGTTAHEVAAALLEDRKPNPKECPTEITPEMRMHAWDYSEYVESLKEESNTVLIEQKFPLWYMPTRNAKIDVAVINPNHLHIVDYKYGEGVVVSPIDNLQGAIYARSVISKWNWVTRLATSQFKVTIHIYQPRGRSAAESPFHIWETTWGEIEEFTNQVYEAAALIQTQRQTTFRLQFKPSEKACQWCPAKGFCSERQRLLTAEIEPLAVIADAAPVLPQPRTITVEQFAAILKHEPQIIKWLSDAKEYALSFMKGGGKIPGFKVVTSRGGNRYWTNPLAAAKHLIKSTILKREEIIEEKVIGPAAVEKLLGKNKFPVAVANLIAKPPGQPVIAAADDPRENALLDGATEFVNLDLAEGKPLPEPNAPGRWVFVLTGSQIQVIKRNGVLYFPAGEWAENEFPVSELSKTPNSERGFIQIFPIIDVNTTTLN